MIDHIGMSVTDVAKSKAFYSSALSPLGYAVVMEFANDVGFGVPPKPDFWIGPAGSDVQPTHIAFRADNRKQVRSRWETLWHRKHSAISIQHSAKAKPF